MAAAPPVATTASMAEQGAKTREGGGSDSGRGGMKEGMGMGEEGKGEVAVAPEGQSCEKGAGVERGGTGDGAPGLVVHEGEGEGKGQEEANGVVGRAEGGDEEEEDEEEFNPYCFIAHLPPYNTVKHHTPEVRLWSRCWDVGEGGGAGFGDLLLFSVPVRCVMVHRYVVELDGICVGKEAE